MHVIRDTWLIFVRSARPQLRNPVTVAFGMIQPIIYLVLFGPLLRHVAGPGGGSSWQWFVPGMLVMLALFGTAYAGFGTIPDLRSGAMERLRVTPASRSALLLGRVLKDVILLLLQAVLLCVLATAFGFRPDIGGLLLGLLLLAALGVAIGSASHALALRLRHEYAFAPVLGSTVVPLMLLSGVLLPMSIAPPWLYWLSRIDPLSYVVDAQRAMAAADLTSATALGGWLAVAGLILVCVGWGVRAIRRDAA